ncbi:MAG: MarR family winged helix-turn-helix transcriptional regulator [Halioglobus sp.]
MNGNETAERNRELAHRLSNNLARMLREFTRDFERRIYSGTAARGFPDIRPSHAAVFANLGMGAVRVTELAERAQVTQQAMGKMLKELEQMGYITRAIDATDKRAKEIRLTAKGIELIDASLEVVEEIYAHYENKIGAQQLHELEGNLRDAIRKLDLEYLPASWVDEPQRAAE